MNGDVKYSHAAVHVATMLYPSTSQSRWCCPPGSNLPTLQMRHSPPPGKPAAACFSAALSMTANHRCATLVPHATSAREERTMRLRTVTTINRPVLFS